MDNFERVLSSLEESFKEKEQYLDDFYEKFEYLKVDRHNYLGEYFGYPKCCVDSFISDTESGYFLQREERQLWGTGYVPCRECNEKYSEKELIDNISRARIHPQAFPNDEF